MYKRNYAWSDFSKISEIRLNNNNKLKWTSETNKMAKQR